MTIDPHKPANADESGVRELYRELPQPQPSAELDQAILLAARQALQNDKVVQLPPRPWHKRLLLPLSIAATVVLSFGVVLRMSHEQAAQVVQLRHADIVQEQEQAAAPAETAAPQAETAAMPQGSAPGAGVSRRPAPRGALPRPDRQRVESGAVAPPVEQKSAPATAAADAPVRPPAVPAAVPAPQPAPEPAAAMAGGEAAGRVAERMANGSAASAPAAAPPLLRKAPRAAAVTGDPALDEIRRLLASGERNQARAALLRYRGANPGVELPADLRILLDEPAAPAGKPQ